jgi:hypothetical protein
VVQSDNATEPYGRLEGRGVGAVPLLALLSALELGLAHPICARTGRLQLSTGASAERVITFSVCEENPWWEGRGGAAAHRTEKPIIPLAREACEMHAEARFACVGGPLAAHPGNAKPPARRRRGAPQEGAAHGGSAACLGRARCNNALNTAHGAAY